MSNVVSAAPPAGDASATHDRSLASRLAGVAAHLARLRDKGQRGPLAELRRLQADGIPGESFWALVQRFDLPQREEGFWRAVLPLMVRYPHERGVRAGRALEAAGVSNARFERWLRLDGAGAQREAPRLLAHLKDRGVDWVDLGHALHRWSEDDRYSLARHFFLARERREPTPTDGAV